MRAHHEVGQLGQGLGQSLSRAAKGRTDSAHIYMGVSVCLPPPSPRGHTTSAVRPLVGNQTPRSAFETQSRGLLNCHLTRPDRING